MAIKEKSRKIGLNPNPNLILCHGGISYCFCSVFKWEWQIKWSPPHPHPTMFFFCQQLRPSFLRWQGVVKDALTSWHCSSVCFWSACCQESSLPCRHLMKKRNRWSEEWWRNESGRQTSCKNECGTFAV